MSNHEPISPRPSQKNTSTWIVLLVVGLTVVIYVLAMSSFPDFF